MKSTSKKVGRKAAHHIDSTTGDPIIGLGRNKDGRWRIISSGKTFVEPDERLAIARFRALTGAKPASQAILIATEAATAYNRETQTHLQELPSNITLADPQIFWATVRDQILKNPKLVAELTGIEEIGYLTNIKKPETLPTFDELETLWKTHAKCIKHQIRKVLRSWKDFVSTTGITSINEITPEIVVAYQDNVYARDWSGKQQQHLFAGIRRVLTFAKGRAIAINAITNVSYCQKSWMTAEA